MSSTEDAPQNHNWNTPESFLSVVRKFDKIKLDPCSNKFSTVNAEIEWYGDDKDGLIESWDVGGLVYVNPPYGRSIPKWIEKCNKQWMLYNTEIILLVPARTDTKWFQDLLWPAAHQIKLMKGRLKFLDENQVVNSAKFPSLIGYYGTQKERFEQVFNEIKGIYLK